MATLTAEDLAALLDEAAWVAVNLHDDGRSRPSGYRGYWPDIVRDQWAYGYNAAESPRERPTARQIDLLDKAQIIVSTVTGPLRRLLWDVATTKHRSSGSTNWAAVARRHGVHPATAKRRWIGALLSVISLSG